MEDIIKTINNFRQIGSPNGMQKIYIEDYVYTYLHKKTKKEKRVCILVGDTQKKDEFTYHYINGAFEIPVEIQNKIPKLDEETRKIICEKIKTYFDGSVLQGWYYEQIGEVPVINKELEKIHRNFFGTKDKILFLQEPMDEDENLYVYENGALKKKSGYYVYYKKNRDMQEFMISQCPEKAGQDHLDHIGTKTVERYRQIIEENDIKKNKWVLQLKRGATLAMSLAVLVLLITMLNNYEKIHEIEAALKTINPEMTISSESLEAGTEENTEVVIETVSGNIENIPKASETEVSLTESPKEEVVKKQEYYIVEPGDTMDSISEKIYGDRSFKDEICKKNAIENPDKIFIGEKIILP